MSRDNLFHESNVQVLHKTFLGRTVLDFANQDNKSDPAEVFVVQSMISGSRRIVSSNGSPWLLNESTKSAVARAVESSWATHWALEIRGEYYELRKVKNSRWPLWQGLKYELTIRPYSILGDNCQQFILNFCDDICVDLDATQLSTLSSGPQLISWISNTLYTLGACSSADLFLNKGRILIPHVSIPIFGICLLILITLVHPRMYVTRLHRLPFTISHTLYLLHSGVTWFLWVLFCAWIWALTGNLYVFGMPFVAGWYHSVFSFYFVEDP